MGVAYAQLLGAPPTPTLYAFLTWPHQLRELRVAACPLAQTTTYYYAENGNDSTGTGTEALPYKTLSKLRTLLASNTRHRLKRGDVKEESDWSATIPVTIGSSLSNVTIDDWYDAATQFSPAPMLNNFRTKYNSAGWALASGNRYTRTETGITVGDVRRQDRRLDVVYTRVASAAACEALSNSWYHDGTTLNINLGGTNPNTLNLEACPKGTVYGLYVNGADKVRIQNLRFDGFGLTWSEQSYGVHVANINGKEAVLVNVECYRTGYHAIGHLGISSDGAGICTMVGCKAGYCAAFGTPTVYISHSVAGNQETILYDCETTYGALPDSSWYPSQGTRFGQSFYAHSSGTIGLVVSHNCVIANNAFGAAEGAGFDNVASASAVENARAFVIGERWTGFGATGNVNINRVGNVKVNCYYEIKPDLLSNQALSNAQQGGWVINTAYLIDCSNQTLADFSLYNSSGPHSPQFWHCFFDAFLDNASWGSLIPWKDPLSASNAPNARMYNSVWQARGALTAGAKPNFVNSSSNLGGNAYFGQLSYTSTGGYDNDPGRLDQPVRVTPEPPSIASPLYHGGVALPGGYALEYDINGNRRNTALSPTVGPFDDPLITPSLGSGGAGRLGG